MLLKRVMEVEILRVLARIVFVTLLAFSITGCFTLPPVYNVDAAALQQALRAGGDPNQDWHGWRPLNFVVAAGYPQYEDRPGYDPASRLAKARILLAAGADPNARSHGTFGTAKWPPLLVAAWQCRVDMARLLLENGADPYAEEPGVGTVLTMSMTSGRCQTVDDQYRLTLALLDHVERKQGREAMLAYAGKPASKTWQFEPRPALHTAAWLKYYGVLAALIEKRVNLDQLVDISLIGDGWTALHIAEAVGNGEVAAVLRRAGARDNIPSGNKGETAAMVRGRFVPPEATWTSAVVQLAGAAVTVQTGNLVGSVQAAYKSKIQEAMYAPTQAIHRTGYLRDSLGGPVPLPPGWAGFDEAIRKADAVRRQETRGVKATGSKPPNMSADPGRSATR